MREVNTTSSTWLLLATLLGCGAELATDEPFPPTLAELYAAHPDRHGYEPTFPLWTNGLEKERELWTPDGSRDPDALPPGSLLFKTFSIDGRPVETRALRVGAPTEHRYAVYLHDELDHDHAELVLADAPVALAIDDGFEHVVPAVSQCGACHEAGAGPVLGFTRTQLEGDLGADVEGEAAWVVGYAWGNCVHCHNGSGTPGSSFDLRGDAFLTNTIGQQTAGSASAGGTRIVAGDAEGSVLYRALARSERVAPMPPLGVQRPDDQAAERVRAWIDSLTTSAPAVSEW